MKKLAYLFSFLAVLFSVHLFAQNVVSGTVLDETGNPIPGVTIVISGTTQGTTSDFDGNFSLNVAPNAQLEISSIGFTSQTIRVDNQSTLSIVLTQSLSELDEIVVTALGLSREKKSLGYAVTEVSGDDINTVKDHNIASSLAGKVPGLIITGSGSIGSASRVTLRGDNSLFGNTQALIVVDGIPINDAGVNSGGGVFNSQVTGGGLTDVNPNDVESISVLKGPNAAALYGSRAGNGVILITTKKGARDGRLGVSLNTNITFDSPMFLPDFQNNYGQGTLGAPYDDLNSNYGSLSWGGELDGSQQLYFTGENRSYRAVNNNVKDFFESAVKVISSISLEKGFDGGSLRFSYTNNDSSSILPNSLLTSHNFNLRGLAELSKKLFIDAKATYFSQEVTNRQSLGSEGIISYVFGIPRSVNVEDLENFQLPNPGLPQEFNVINYAGPNSNTGNPYWLLRHDKNDERRNRFFGFAKINYTFNDWLSAFVRVGSDITGLNNLTIEKPGHHFYRGGRYRTSNSQFKEFNTDVLVTAKQDINEKLDVIFNVGGNLSKRSREGLVNSGDTFRVPTGFFLSNLKNLNPPEELFLEIEKVNSVYGNLNFSYDDFLYVDLTTRNDWSSTLAAENRSFLYSSVNISALLHEFIDPDKKLLNLLKLRGSWAEVGNDTEPYQLYQTFDVAGQGYLDLTTLISSDLRLNPLLKPETISTIEFGFDLSLLDNRLGVEFSVYNIATTDLIFRVPVSPATGFSEFLENVGRIENKGVEVSFNANLIRKDRFNWNTNLFFSRNKNELVELINDVERFSFNSTNSGNLSLVAQVGGGIGDLYGTIWSEDNNGNKLVNSNGIPIASAPNNYLGNTQPDWLGGFSNTFIFDDLSLSFLIDARIGGQVFSETSSFLDGQGVSERSLQYRAEGTLLNAVVNTDGNPVNTTVITGQEYWQSYAGIAENYVFDQTNIRLREIALGYQFNQLDDLGIQNVNLQLIGRNLFFLLKDADDIDPENALGTTLGAQGINSRNLPTVRSLGFNVTLNF